MEERMLYEKAIEHWGVPSQIFMLFEEMAELQVAVCKLGRKHNGGTVTEVIEEIADVEIMLEQLKIIINMRSEALQAVKRRKLERLEKLIEVGEKS